MRKQKLWRVRIRRASEDWITVHADTPREAEELASTLPQVLSVFDGSAIKGDKPVDQVPPAGVEDEDEQ